MTPDPLLAKYRMAGWPDPIAEGLATWEGERLVDTIEAREQASHAPAISEPRPTADPRGVVLEPIDPNDIRF